MFERETFLRERKDGSEYRVNGVVVVGNMTKDSQKAIEVSANGKPTWVINSIGSNLPKIAANYTLLTENGYEKKTKWLPFKAWGPIAKYVETFKKGDQVTIKGQIKVEAETYTKDGKDFSREVEYLLIETAEVNVRKSPKMQKEDNASKEMEQVDDTPF